MAASLAVVGAACAVADVPQGSGAAEGEPGAPTTSVPQGAGFPCEVATLLETKCQACHGDTPSEGATGRLVTMTDLLGPSKSVPDKNAAVISLARMKDVASPMPPAFYSDPVTPTEVAAFDAWIKGNYQGSCGDNTPAAPPPAVDGGAEPAASTTDRVCTACHGDPARAPVAGADPKLQAAPPRNTKGETAPTARAVGAHQAHLTKGSFSKLVLCNDCHVVPQAPGHSNGVVGLTFGPLAKTGNRTPSFNNGRCASTYCHGSFTGGKNAALAWTDGAMTCTSCHDGPPPTGDHRRGAHDFACSECHGEGFTATTVNKALHINGVKNVGGAGSKITTYDPATRSCTPTCHGRERW